MSTAASIATTRYSSLLHDFACLVSLLNRYIQENMYTHVDKIMRAHSASEVISALNELLRDARGRFPKLMPNAEEIAKFEDAVSSDIEVAHVIAGFSYTFLGKDFFSKYCKKEQEEGS